MRTIKLKDELMSEALRRSSAQTTRVAVAEASRAANQIRRQSGIRKLRGKVKWEGDLDAMRAGRQSLT